jgi:hypothetical protein
MISAHQIFLFLFRSENFLRNRRDTNSRLQSSHNIISVPLYTLAALNSLVGRCPGFTTFRHLLLEYGIPELVLENLSRVLLSGFSNAGVVQGSDFRVSFRVLKLEGR